MENISSLSQNTEIAEAERQRRTPSLGRISLHSLGVAVGANNVGDTGKCRRGVAQSRGDHAGVQFTNLGNVKASYVAVKSAMFSLVHHFDWLLSRFAWLMPRFRLALAWLILAFCHSPTSMSVIRNIVAPHMSIAPSTPCSISLLTNMWGVCVLVCIAISGHHESHHLLSAIPRHRITHTAIVPSDALRIDGINSLVGTLFDAGIPPPPHPLLHL